MENEERYLEEGFVRLVFYLEDHEIKTETVWCVPISDGRLRVASSAFYVKDVCVDDVVNAEKNDDGTYKFLSVESRTMNTFLFVYKVSTEKCLNDFIEGCSALGVRVDKVVTGCLSVSIPVACEEAIESLIFSEAEDAGLDIDYLDECVKRVRVK